MTGNERDPYATWVSVWINDRRYPIMQRGTFTICMWVSAVALGGWLLTQFLTA